MPPFRVDLFIQGEHLPVVSDIADPGASFEGRAKLTTRYLDPRTLEKQPLLPPVKPWPSSWACPADWRKPAMT